MFQFLSMFKSSSFFLQIKICFLWFYVWGYAVVVCFFSVSLEKLFHIIEPRALIQYLALLIRLFNSSLLLLSYKLHIHDLFFETDVGRSDEVSLFLSCARAELPAIYLFHEYLSNSNLYIYSTIRILWTGSLFLFS